VALPLIIHLINQRRYQTVKWAAMMFLLAANRMSRGYARIRQWLIMAMRMAAIAALVFAASRPLSGGWLGLTAGGRPDTTIVLLDRSPSMQQIGAEARGSKLETGLKQLVGTLETLGSARWVLIESNHHEPRELEKVADLLTSPATAPSSASADVPAMLISALEYLKANKAGRAEIWICSDIRANDWNADSGRWQVLRDGFAELQQGVRFHLLAYPQPAPANLWVRVTDVSRRKAGDGAELLVSLKVKSEGPVDGKVSLPVQFEIDGARSEVTVELAGGQAELKDHRIPLEKGRERGWGRVSIPADANPADNDDWFVFEQPRPRRTLVVAADVVAGRPLLLAASIPPAAGFECTAEVLAADQLAAVDWGSLSLLLWQAPLPDPQTSKQVQAVVDRGGTVIFFPSRVGGEGEIFGVRWGPWAERTTDASLKSWRGDQDLLAHTHSGQPLPVGELRIKRSRAITGEVTPLATLDGNVPLLVRSTTSRGAAYFCATTPAPGDSSLATSGVVFYVMVQRALASGAKALENTRRLTAGEPPPDDPAAWKRIAGAHEVLSTDFSFERGIYADGDRLLAVDRSDAEAGAPVVAETRVDELFRGLDYARVDDRAGSLASLIQEIWRLFLVAMLVAMVAEAALCLPRAARPSGGAS
jgi:hypothetical protein